MPRKFRPVPERTWTRRLGTSLGRLAGRDLAPLCRVFQLGAVGSHACKDRTPPIVISGHESLLAYAQCKACL
jgi:hypothetical protein